ncbi:PIN domain-containing protein [Streptomyces sp. NPDC051219]|uniref:PIN domain-containing protein n=1 Tax=Streptomyces sp. NPDC051219 TaxID=3155283 RepID=UPI0034481A5C
MIILDTCVIRGMSLDSSDAEVLRAIRRTKTERVGAPWMAVEELAAQKAIEYVEAHRAAATALTQLRRKSHQVEPVLGAADPEGVRKLWRAKHGELLEILPTSEAALREGMLREANVLPPAKRRGEGNRAVKIGARDVAIWLTAVEYARDHPDETVYFVSSNHKDFTKGGGAAYPPPMDADVEGLGDRFRHLTNLGEVLALVAPRVEVDESEVRTVLAEHAVLYVHDMARGIWGSLDAQRPFQVMTQAGTVDDALGWLGHGHLPEVKLVDVNDVQAYRLGDAEYFVASTRWQIAGPTLVGGRFVMAACHWNPRLLANVTPENRSIQMLAHGTIQAVPNPEEVDWRSPIYKTFPPDAILQVAKDQNRKPTWLEVFLAVTATLGMTPSERQSYLDAVQPGLDTMWTDGDRHHLLEAKGHSSAPVDDEPDNDA